MHEEGFESGQSSGRFCLRGPAIRSCRAFFVALEVVPDKAERHKNDKGDEPPRFLLVAHALINRPPTTDGGQYARGYQKQSNPEMLSAENHWVRKPEDHYRHDSVKCGSNLDYSSGKAAGLKEAGGHCCYASDGALSVANLFSANETIRKRCVGGELDGAEEQSTRRLTHAMRDWLLNLCRAWAGGRSAPALKRKVIASELRRPL